MVVPVERVEHVREDEGSVVVGEHKWFCIRRGRDVGEVSWASASSGVPKES